MMLFRQEAFLLFLACNFVGMDCGPSKETTGNCSFDENTLCSWCNDDDTDHFDWQLRRGSSPGNNTGPISDHSGDGSYIYIDTSLPRKYNEKARLNSPLMRGAQRMTFFYAMYGSTVESLSVYVRINDSEERIWSRYGNHLSSNWIKGCVAVNNNGTFQVIIEGVAGVTFTSNVAIDDVTFSTNLTCVSAGKPMPPETFEVNCTFDESYCGWRKILTSPNDQISWYRKRSGNQSQGTEPSEDHTGGGEHIYVHKSPSSQVNQPAQLLSPLIQGPKCLRFYYYMNGNDIGNLDVLLWLREQQGSYLMWRRSGKQGDQWIEASVSVGYTGEYQFFFQATIDRNYTGGIAVDDVTLTNGLCESESESQNNQQGNCDFDSNFCFWRNDLSFNFTWTPRRYHTPSSHTGPSADHTSGTGMYVYIETFSPRQPGDTARLESPWMRGPQCMTFYYHMYGSTMSCVVIFVKSQATNKLKPVWLRSQDQGDHWIQGKISINETSSYQIIVDGIRGRSHGGDAAFDDVSFERGTCNQTEETLYHVYSYNGNDFQIFTQPSEHGLYFEEFRFTLKHPRGHPNEATYFIYSEASSGQSFVSSNFDTSGYRKFPVDVVVLNDERVGSNSRRVYLIDRSNYGPMISLHDHGNVICCKGRQTSFYAHKVTEEFSGHTMGVLREVWNNVYFNPRTIATLREQPVFKTPSQSQMILRDFDAPVDVADYYAQRLTSYLQVPDSGNYTFYLSCDDWCELWMYDVLEYGTENQNKKTEESLTKQPIIAVYAWTGRLQWNKYPQQMAEPIFLNKSRFYEMKVFMFEFVREDHVSVGMRKPNGDYERPIPGTRLFWTKPVSLLSQNNMTQSSSALLPFESIMAMDRSYATCYRSKKESNPWWQVTLEKTLYVESVEITNNIDCCPRVIGIINVTVSTSPLGLDPTCTELMEYGGKTENYKFLCSPPARGSYVTVTLTGDNITLVLCQVVVKTIEFPSQARGVLRESWYNVNFDMNGVPTMRQHPIYKTPPQNQMILHDFDAPVGVGDNYVQRLTSYLQIPDSGNYTFYLSCDDWCELWKYDVDEDGINWNKKSEESLSKQPLIALNAWTEYLRWNKFPNQMSQPIFLDKCRVYQMEVFMRELVGGDHASVGMRRPSGEYERPIPGTRLFRTKPGKRRLKVTLQDHETSLSDAVGSKLRISGFYQFCCEGIYCPDCPIELNISTLGENVTLSSALNLSCVNTSFTATFNTDTHPGTHTVKISYSFINNPQQIIDEKVIGHVYFPGNDCNFDINFCNWRNGVNFSFTWTLRRYNTQNSQTGPSADHTSGTGMYAYLETSSPRQPEETARLESPWMRGPQCMTFFYHMHGSTMSCVVIYIKNQATNRLKPVWLRSQDQGNQWIQGKISISETSSYQIIVDGIKGNSDKGDAALDDISFERGTCNQTEETLFYVYSYNGKDFRIFTQPSEHGLYFEEFRFTLEHPREHRNETTYFIYSKASSGQNFVTSKLDPSSYDRFPLDVVVLNSKRVESNSRKVYLIDRSNYGPMISLYDQGNVTCCKGKQTLSFYAHNVTEEFLGQARGVLREVWYQVDYLQRGLATIREQPVFKTPPQSQMILREFDAPVNVADRYVQRLTSYLQVSDSGNYIFYLSCDDRCELWKYDVDEFGMENGKKKAEENLTKKLIIAVYAWTGYLQWNKYRQQTSQPIFLDKSHIYQMEVFMRENVGGDHASVGMRTPSGEYERPIRGTRLFWTKPVSSLSQNNMTRSSSVLLPFDAFMAIDRSYATCYRSEKESNPWWQVTLKKTLYVESVEITDKIDCCPRDIGMINITVSTSPTGLDPTCTESMEYGGKIQNYKFLCSPPARGSYVTVTLIGDSVTLVLCHVVVKTIEFIGEARGVLREVWYKVNMVLNRVPTMRQHPVFNSPPQSQMILPAFDAPVHVGNYYIQRLTSYLQVPDSGNYTFYVSCDDWCELWEYDVHEYDIESRNKKGDESLTKQPIIAFDAWTGYLQWNKYPQQMSQPVFLDKCRIYKMEVFMYERRGGDHVSVGMRKPSGKYERPIPGARLFWTKPGIRRLKVALQDNEKLLSGVVGSELRISGFYQFCCEGVYCPDCPLELNISTLGQYVSVNSALNFSCINTSFTATFNTDRQPGESAIKVSYSSVNNSHRSVDEEVLGHVHIQAAILEECYFDLGYCGWTSVGEDDKWKLSLNNAFIKYPGSFAYIDNSYKGRSISPLLPWKPFHQYVGVCLRFNYIMPIKSKSSLKVFLRNTKQEMLLLLWQSVGYHGKKWSAAQVAWPGAEGTQIIFEGEGFLDNEINVAIDNVIVKTENCSLRPYFAEPDFRCSSKQFTCKNGECIKRNLLCDGDFACKDESDEDDCGCPSSMFLCQGGACLLATAVCDGKKDCYNGDDENNCRNPCPYSHHCVGGSCIAWSKTCTQTAFCGDGTNTPSVCGSGKCHLNDLACNSTEPTRCESFIGHCSFQNGLCGLKSDKNATFHWTVGSGKTPTENTGPNYDHTSFNEDGSYIFIEASQKTTGDKARLLSDDIEPSENVCVQFWYHMHGSDTGNLSIYVKTNQSETLVWRLSGDQGNRWRFGQTALNSPSLYKFVIEGTVGNGSRGDIAVDDLTVMDGVCEEIIKQASPDCDFEESLCNWGAEQGWVLATRVEEFETSGGFVASLPAGASELPSSLSSPVINVHYYEWKCLRFWYFIGATDAARDWHTTSLMLLLRTVTSNQTVVLFFADEVTDRARYTQIPLSRNSTNSQISFEGFNKLPGGHFLAIDDVSFSKEPCKQIPPKQDGECQKDLGMENGAISDRQITASSQLDANHAAVQGRLNSEEIANGGGSWSAASNDSSQWLQVDLGSHHTKVTRVATQGRHDAAQWVTKYKVQYSNDGVNFHYYMEPRKMEKKDFAANADQDSVVYQELNPPIRARYIRFRPEAWHDHISMRVELYGCRRACQEALGMENGAILDGQITASSQWDDNLAPFQGRLHFQASGKKQGSWSAAKNDVHQWLQVDLGSQFTTVTRVATQGRNGGCCQWVKRYKLQYCDVGVNFQYYREQGQTADKEFSGNTDADTVVYHDLNPPIRARYIRFRPELWLNAISLRAELYGCQGDCLEALGMENGAISDGQISASSQLDPSHAFIQARLHFKATAGKAGSWSARSNVVNQWFQVDLGSRHTKVTRVATQGRNDSIQWVTKYKLQYSDDGVNFQYYKEQGQTAAKNFSGNKDQDSVVYHELNPPIKARFIRFLPQEWVGNISMRVELYGCQDDRPCDTSTDWCGWKNVLGWKRIKYREHQDKNHQDKTDEGNYEIHLPDIRFGYVSFPHFPWHGGDFTICFWLKTKYSGFFIEYEVASTMEQNATLVLGLYFYNHSFEVLFGSVRSNIAMGVADDIWHHVCVVREGETGLLAFFKDGERNYQSNEFRAGSLNGRIEGIATMTIGFRSTNKTESDALVKLSGFNMWTYAIIAEEILRMSYGCGQEAGQAKAWETVKQGLKKNVTVQWFRTCNDRKGDRLVVDTNVTGFNQTAVLVSSVYNRSHHGHSKCLRFRYMLKGPGEKTLTIYQKADNGREIPVWVSKKETGSNWIYGQVPLSSISKFQVSIKVEAEKSNDLIALTGLYIDGERYCKHEPLSAKQACSENLFNMSGYLISPSFPGYYLDDMFCTWHITVPSGYVIHLEFHEFRLKDYSKCEDCFLQIFDGKDETAPTIGRFCGYVYPPVLVSLSNHFTIVLYCSGNLHKARFKAFYHSVGALEYSESSCLPQQGCPSSCECKEFGENQHKKILVTGEDLLTVPRNLPFDTGAVHFQQNQISQLREKDFADLPKLEYIDMSFNVLIHLDEESFHNVTSVTTLRLNFNFFHTLPVGAFTGLPSLRVLDLGANLLRKAVGGLLDGLLLLEVLSLRSNQLNELEYGVFGNNSDMKHLYLQENKLTTLPDGLFGALSQLKLLNLSTNELTVVSKDTFRGLISLEYLYLDRNKLAKVPSDAFSELTNLKYVKLDRFILCCYAEKSIAGVDCESPVDEFSSCDDLMKNKTVQICVWILGILAFLGNLFVIIWRIIDKEENRVHSFLLTNLAVADMLMGVYLLTIAIMDVRWRGIYFKHDIDWRSGMGCQIVGVLSMLSSEVSVLTLTIITMDRFLCIVFPFKFKRLTFKTASFACVVVWIFGAVISVIPIAGFDYFHDNNGNFGFYSRSAVCLPLQLSEGRAAGWEYSVAFFVGLNFVSFLFILVAYITMFWTVKRSARAVRSTNLNKESAMAKRLVFIVMTDFCCWMPIIIISILSLTGNFDDPNKIAYVWIAVFVLPLNSSLNPILYTFSTERAKRSLTRRRLNVTGFVMKRINGGGATENQSVDRPISHGDNTVTSNASNSPLQLTKAAGTQEQEKRQVRVQLRLIEEVNILQGDTAGQRSAGYVVAWCEEGNILSKVLLKYFEEELKEEWHREADIVQSLSCGVEPHANLLRYRWHSKACDQNLEHGKEQIRTLHSNSFLICYEFVSVSTLKDFLYKKGTGLNFDTVCAIAYDVISAIERLQDLGILHNNITTSNILIGQRPMLPAIKAVLGGFSQASKVKKVIAYSKGAIHGQSNYGNDIEQFGQLLATLLGKCHGSSEYDKVHEIMNLCFEENVENQHRASYIRHLLEEAWCAEGIRDTCL